MLILKLLSALFFIFCYQQGGQGPKWMRRFLGPSVIAFGLLTGWFFNHSLSWLSSIGAILYLAASNGFSYGEKFTQNKTWKKILFRGLCGASYGLCGLLIGIGHNHVYLGVSQLIISTVFSIIFGVFSPIPNSLGNWKTRAEDIIISLSYSIPICFI